MSEARIDVQVEHKHAPPPAEKKHPNTCPKCGSHYRDDELEASVQVFYVRRGRVVGRKGFVLDKVEDLDTPNAAFRMSLIREEFQELLDFPPAPKLGS